VTEPPRSSSSVGRPRAKNRFVGWIISFAVLAAGGVFAFRYFRSTRDEGPRFETTKIDRGRITARVTATGTVSALVTVQVGSQVSGRIQQINVDFNSPVKKGQIIAKIDPELFRAAIEQARANFVASKGNLAKAKAQAEDAARQAERTKQLADRNLVAPADRDTALANAAAAAAQVEASEGELQQAEAALHQASVNLTYATIVSPIDGVVISRNVDVRQTVAASLQAPTLFTIAEDLKKMQVDTSVAEADVGKLEANMPATFTVDAYPSERFSGTVRQIRNAPQTVQNVVTYDAVIDVDNSSLKLKPGMTANVTFVYADKRDTLRVANSALRFRPPAEMLSRPKGNNTSEGAASAAPVASAAPTGSTAPASSSEWHGSRHGGGEHGTGGERGGGWGERAGRGDHAGHGGDRPLDARTVWVLRGTDPEPHSIRVGITDGTLSEIVDGDVQDGELAITGVSAGGAPSGAGGPPAGGSNQFRRLF
jgi:HlyD family secretion protein